MSRYQSCLLWQEEEEHIISILFHSSQHKITILADWSALPSMLMYSSILSYSCMLAIFFVICLLIFYRWKKLVLQMNTSFNMCLFELMFKVPVNNHGNVKYIVWNFYQTCALKHMLKQLVYIDFGKKCYIVQ